MSLTDHRRRRNLLFVVAFVITNVIPISGDQPAVPSPITAEIKCGSCPSCGNPCGQQPPPSCGNPCGQQPPPPPPPSPPPPPPPTIPGIPNCPPPPPPPCFEFNSPPGLIYTVDPTYFPSGANRNLEKLMKVLVSLSLLWLWEFWML